MRAKQPFPSAEQLYLIRALRPPVDERSLRHRQFPSGAFWRQIPAYAEISEEEFLDHKWQAKNSVTNPNKLRTVLGDLVREDFIADVELGCQRSPMSIRVSPYIMSLVGWSDPYRDPLRRQFIPLASQLIPDHPKVGLDSLGEQDDSPVPGLTHRYKDKALFLAIDTCPVYCRFCTRSYAVGVDTEEVGKVNDYGVDEERWHRAFAYIASRPEVEDIVVSGGDVYSLRATQLKQIGNALLDIPHVRRIRFGTKGPAVVPQKLLSDEPWFDALTRLVDRGRKEHKEVAIHTHFNHPSELTWITQEAMNRLFERGVNVRNQSVLLRGVNDDVDTMTTLVKRLSYLNIQPYYVYVHDLVKGVEELRTSLQTAIYLEKHVRGATSGFKMPTFVCDLPGGGGKRDVHSYEHYDRATGISVFTAPTVKTGRFFVYFDPVDSLSDDGRARWSDPTQHHKMIDRAVDRARAKSRI